MTKSILCTVTIGILVGVAAFFMPHLLLGIIIFFAIIRMLHCGCRSRRGCCGSSYGGHHHEKLFYMADKIRKMSEEEYAEFKTKMSGGCCDSGYHSHSHCGCGCGSNCNCGGNCNCNSESNCDCKDSKKEEITK